MPLNHNLRIYFVDISTYAWYVQYLTVNLEALSRICLVVHPPNGTVRLPYLHRSALKGRD